MDDWHNIEKTKVALLDRAILGILLSYAPTLVFSFFFIKELGWQPMVCTHWVVLLLFTLVFFLKNRFPVHVKAYVVAGSLVVMAMSGLYWFEFPGGGYLILVPVFIARLVFGIKETFVYLMLFAIGGIVVFLLSQNNLVQFPQTGHLNYFQFHAYWWFGVLGYFLSALIILYLTSLFFNFYKTSLSELVDKKEALIHAFTKEKEVEAQLQESEKKYRSIFDGSFDGFVFFNKDNVIFECNQSFSYLIGYTQEEVMGKDITGIAFREWVEADQLSELKRQIEKRGSTGLVETELIHKSGDIIPVEMNMHRLLQSKQVFYWAVVHDISYRRKNDMLIHKAMVKSEEKERGRYAKELHDGLGPLLSTSMIYLHTMRSEDDKQAMQEYIDRTYGLIEEAVQSIREISNQLSPAVLRNYGLVHAVRAFIEKLNPVSEIEFSINTNLKERLIDLQEFTLYRTLVELINNAVKYSRAQKIGISVVVENGIVKVNFRDNGLGFEYEKIKRLGVGFGLTNLENRILRIGGKYVYLSKPGQGTNVDISIKAVYL